MKRLLHYSLFWLGCLALCACSSLPFLSSAPKPPPAEPDTYRNHLHHLQTIQSFAVNGRIGVITEKKGFSGSMRWYHNSEGDEISLFSPLGSQLGQLSASADGVTLTTSDHKTYTAHDAETLTQDNLGWSLPLSGLSDWVLGRPTTTSNAQVVAWDDAGHITRMQQDGWDIEYPSYRESDGFQLPGKVLLKSQKLDIKLIIEEWVGLQAGQ